ENGLIVFALFRPDAPVDQISENETITEDEFVGSLKGKSMSDLITAMSNGSIYANIHTQDNPNGEIRGQIMSSNP
ncbi:MAG: CHRD domain-containing protein, partial [Nitrosopumilus sp.]|nr:CHRD domain-containing protein [Nitrosopumilus sp.]